MDGRCTSTTTAIRTGTSWFCTTARRGAVSPIGPTSSELASVVCVSSATTAPVTAGLPPVDAAVLTGDRAEHTKRNFDRAIAHGIAGWRDDDIAFTKPWGFELDEIRAPTLLWQGVQDKMVPVAHARWLAERIPGVEAHISEDDGHLSISVGRLGEIYDWLAAKL